MAKWVNIMIFILLCMLGLIFEVIYESRAIFIGMTVIFLVLLQYLTFPRQTYIIDNTIIKNEPLKYGYLSEIVNWIGAKNYQEKEAIFIIKEHVFYREICIYADPQILIDWPPKFTEKYGRDVHDIYELPVRFPKRISKRRY